MQGIRFITDDKKNIIGAQIDLRTHQNTFDEFFSELITGGRMAGTQGVVFIKDSKGNIWAAQIDLRLHQNTFDEFFSELIVKGAQQPVTPVNPNLARTERVNTVVVAARSFLGTKYQTGGDSLTFMAYKTIGVQLPRRSVDQMKSGKAVDRTQLQPGDLVFFATNVKEPNRINHVGLVTKAGPQPSVLHSSSSRGVVEEAMGNKDLAQMFRGAVRVV